MFNNIFHFFFFVLSVCLLACLLDCTGCVHELGYVRGYVCMRVFVAVAGGGDGVDVAYSVFTGTFC